MGELNENICGEAMEQRAKFSVYWCLGSNWKDAQGSGKEQHFKLRK